ncbi:MAG: DtxR family transcriptional regulator [bacterium]|nr:DtxR family transcriptional regulator [bacterium]
MAQISNLSSSLEDYLEIILQLVQEQGEARAKDIAQRKSVRMASVTGALKRLTAEGLISYQARESVTLTKAGEELAGRILGRHEFIARFLHEILGVDGETASRDACAIEHVISLESLDRLAGFVEYLKLCPEVDELLISRFLSCYNMGCKRVAGGRGEKPKECNSTCPRGFHDRAVKIFSRKAGVIQLSELKPGDRARVVSVRGSVIIRQRLIDMGVLPGAQLEMQRVAPLGDPIDIKLKGYHLSLRKIEAATISVERV